MPKKNKVQITTTLAESDLIRLKEISGDNPLNKVLSKWINLSDDKGNIAPSRSMNFKSRGNTIDNMISAINLVCPGYFNDTELIFSDSWEKCKSEENKVIFLNNFETLDICANKVLKFFLEDYTSKGFTKIDKSVLRDRVEEIFKIINSLEV